MNKLCKQTPIKVGVINRSGNDLPKYATDGAACADVRAHLAKPVTVRPSETVLIKTGLSVEIPSGFEIQIRARSGLALRHGVSIPNGIGVIDSDYRGEVGVILHNYGNEPYTVRNGDRVAQMTVCPVYRIEWQKVEKMTETGRNVGGYGSTGVK